MVKTQYREEAERKRTRSVAAARDRENERRRKISRAMRGCDGGRSNIESIQNMFPTEPCVAAAIEGIGETAADRTRNQFGVGFILKRIVNVSI
jgi:hypothetical protein